MAIPDLLQLSLIPINSHRLSYRIPTFIQHWSEDGQVIIDSSAIPSAATELMLTLLDADFHPLCHTRHDFHIVAAEAELFGHQTRN